MVFGINVLANINFMGKIQRKYKTRQKLSKSTFKVVLNALRRSA